MANWIGAATEKMKSKGTLGSFGKATSKKISAAKRVGGLEKKKAIFAQNMKRIAQKHKHEGNTKPARAKIQNRKPGYIA